MLWHPYLKMNKHYIHSTSDRQWMSQKIVMSCMVLAVALSITFFIRFPPLVVTTDTTNHQVDIMVLKMASECAACVTTAMVIVAIVFHKSYRAMFEEVSDSTVTPAKGVD